MWGGANKRRHPQHFRLLVERRRDVEEYPTCSSPQQPLPASVFFPTFSIIYLCSSHAGKWWANNQRGAWIRLALWHHFCTRELHGTNSDVYIPFRCKLCKLTSLCLLKWKQNNLNQFLSGYCAFGQPVISNRSASHHLKKEVHLSTKYNGEPNCPQV